MPEVISINALALKGIAAATLANVAPLE